MTEKEANDWDGVRRRGRRRFVAVTVLFMGVLWGPLTFSGVELLACMGLGSHRSIRQILIQSIAFSTAMSCLWYRAVRGWDLRERQYQDHLGEKTR